MTNARAASLASQIVDQYYVVLLFAARRGKGSAIRRVTEIEKLAFIKLRKPLGRTALEGLSQGVNVHPGEAPGPGEPIQHHSFHISVSAVRG